MLPMNLELQLASLLAVALNFRSNLLKGQGSHGCAATPLGPRLGSHPSSARKIGTEIYALEEDPGPSSGLADSDPKVHWR
jgi:hypothetical protein